jgi:hydrogenase maturation factor
MHKTPLKPTASGKISVSLFERAILPKLGSQNQNVIIGPKAGSDAGIIDIGNNQVLVTTTDPFFIVPEFGWKRAAWFAVHIIASDAATAGFAPQYMSIDLNLPPEMKESEFEQLWDAIHTVCTDLSIAIVTGHTGWYDDCSYPMLGGATIFSVGAKSAYLTPGMAQVGDAVILTKGAAIETTGIMGIMFSEQISTAYDKQTAQDAAAAFDEMSVVKDALTAVQIGVRQDGVTGMHDATERGVFGALCEIAEVANAGMVIDKGAIPIRPVTQKICTLFAIDPYSASSEGTLLLTCRPHKKTELIAHLHSAEISAAEIGEITPKEKGVMIAENGSTKLLTPPEFDPFWPAYMKALAEKK